MFELCIFWEPGWWHGSAAVRYAYAEAMGGAIRSDLPYFWADGMTKTSVRQLLPSWSVLLLLSGLTLFSLAFYAYREVNPGMNSIFFRGTNLVLTQTLLSPVFLIAVTSILLCEKWLPVHREQTTFSRGMLQDSVWVLLALVFEATIISIYVDAIHAFHATHLRALTFRPLEIFPEGPRFVLGIMIADFLAWFQHWLKHKVPWFWHIHAVHHSQTQINMFTDLHYHMLEYLISRPVVMLPLLMLSIGAPQIVLWVLFSKWYTRFYHANIKTDLGPLRHILVTPQSHRVHHSIETRHQDKNFGVLFSIWDRLFKTRYAGSDEYPQTGIRDASFPHEKGAGIRSLLLAPVHQHVYPFVAIGKSLVRSG